MRYISLILFISCLVACQEKDNAPTYSPAQSWLMNKQAEYDKIIYRSANSLAKAATKDSFLKVVNNYFADSLQFILRNFRVKTVAVRTSQILNIHALTAEFTDQHMNEFWMEFDYPLTDQGKKDMENNPAYKFSRGLEEKKDTTISFFYMGDIKWDYIYDDRFRIQVVPFHKDYNFDSSRAANAKKPK